MRYCTEENKVESQNAMHEKTKFDEFAVYHTSEYTSELSCTI